MGERYLIVLNDTIPTLSECLEDEKSEVEEVAKAIVKRIESLTGESIQDYMKWLRWIKDEDELIN